MYSWTLAVRVFYGGFRAPNSTWKRAGARFCRTPTRQWNIVYYCCRETSRKSYDDSIVASCKTIQFAFHELSSQIKHRNTMYLYYHNIIKLYVSLSEYLSRFRGYLRFFDFSGFHDLRVWFIICVQHSPLMRVDICTWVRDISTRVPTRRTQTRILYVCIVTD